jgi:hypothetical protein
MVNRMFRMLAMHLYKGYIVFTSHLVDLGGLVVSVLATGPKVRGFDPDRGRCIFKGDKAVGPMS